MRDAMASDPPQAITVKLLNYKINRQPFWNALHIAPIRSSDGQVMFFVGVQLDITAPPTPKTTSQQPSWAPLPQHGCAHTPIDHKTDYSRLTVGSKPPKAMLLQSPAASDQAQGSLDSLESAAAEHDSQQQAEAQSPMEGNRQLLQRQSAPAGSTMAAAADRAAMLPDVSHLQINTHVSHPVNGFVDLPECGEVRLVWLLFCLVNHVYICMRCTSAITFLLSCVLNAREGQAVAQTVLCRLVA